LYLRGPTSKGREGEEGGERKGKSSGGGREGRGGARLPNILA